MRWICWFKTHHRPMPGLRPILGWFFVSVCKNKKFFLYIGMYCIYVCNRRGFCDKDCGNHYYYYAEGKLEWKWRTFHSRKFIKCTFHKMGSHAAAPCGAYNVDCVRQRTFFYPERDVPSGKHSRREAAARIFPLSLGEMVLELKWPLYHQPTSEMWWWTLKRKLKDI